MEAQNTNYDEVTDLDPTAKFHRVTWDFNDIVYVLEIELSTGFKVTKFAQAEIEHAADFSQKNASKGLGDTVEKTIKKVTRGKVKPCPGCKKRRDALNKLIPYKGSNDGN